MRIQDIERVCDASRNEEVDVALAKRYGAGVNAFWLSREAGGYPLLLILVNKELSSIHYFPMDRHPGFRSVGHVQGLAPEGMTTFFMNSIHEPQQMLNDSVVPFSAALTAAKEFLMSNVMPPSVEWLEL